jgi:hypothetical protein
VINLRQMILFEAKPDHVAAAASVEYLDEIPMPRDRVGLASG